MSMNTTTNDMDATEPTEQESDSSPGGKTDGSAVDADDVITYLQWGTLLAFAVLAVVAGIGLYTGLGSIIEVWVASEYQPVAQTGLNLGLLAAAVAGITVIIRRL